MSAARLRTGLTPRSRLFWSIVVQRLEEVDAVIDHSVDNAMFLGEPPGPAAGTQILERLGLADSPTWVSKNGIDDVQHTQRNLAIGLYPVAEVIDKFRLEHRCTLAVG